ncbi:MAG: MFS transporter [Chloroflexota bacterium]
MLPRLSGLTAPLREIDRPILILATISFISQVGVSIMLPLLPIYAIQLGASPRELGLMVSIFAVTVTVGQLGSGFLSEHMTARRMLPLGQAAYAAANFLIATAGSAVALIAYRSLAGFGGGLSIIAERLYLARVADRARLAFTNGVLSAAGSAGSVLGPVFGGLLALVDLRIPFIVVGITATAAAISAALFLPAEARAIPAGQVPSALDPGEPDLPVADLALPAAHLVAGPLGSETTAASRSGAHAQALAMWPLIALGLWNLCFNAAYGGWITTFGPYAKDELGLPLNQVTLIFAMFGLGAIFIGPWLSRVADRRGQRGMVAFGSMLVLLNLIAMIIHAPVLVVFGSAIAGGGGLAAAQSSWFALLTVATDGGRSGRSFGLVTALSNLGVVAGALLASEIWQQVGIDQALVVAAGFMVLATVSLLLVRARPTAAPEAL